MCNKESFPLVDLYCSGAHMTNNKSVIKNSVISIKISMRLAFYLKKKKAKQNKIAYRNINKCNKLKSCFERKTSTFLHISTQATRGRARTAFTRVKTFSDVGRPLVLHLYSQLALPLFVWPPQVFNANRQARKCLFCWYTG